jgi:hypothetical protein
MNDNNTNLNPSTPPVTPSVSNPVTDPQAPADTPPFQPPAEPQVTETFPPPASMVNDQAGSLGDPTPPSIPTDIPISADNGFAAPPTGDTPTDTPSGETIVTSDTPPPPPKGGGKRIASALAILLLVGGVSAGVLLVNQNQNVQEKAAEPTATATSSGEDLTSGEEEATGPQCLETRAYKVIVSESLEEWQKLTTTTLSTLKAGDEVYFTVVGTATDKTKFTKARFKINSQAMVEVNASTNTKEPFTSDPANQIEIYYKYTIPANVTTFTVKSAIYHDDIGWIDSV